MTHLEIAFPSNYAVPNSSYTFNRPRQQNFPFRWPIIKYILKNPTGKAWKKLIQTCKYFYAKYPVYPVKQLTHNKNWEADGEKVDSTKILSRIWLFEAFCFICWHSPDIFNESISRIFKCDLRILGVHYYELTWENYVILTSSGSLKKLLLNNSRVKYSDNKDVTIDKLLEKLEHVEKFTVLCTRRSKMFEKDTVKKMTEIISGSKDLRRFELTNLDETFDLSALMDFLLKNETVSVDLDFESDLHFSDASKQMLENCFEQLLTSPPKKLPKIYIFEFDGEKYKDYQNFYSANLKF